MVDAAGTADRRAARPGRSLWWVVHSWAGLKISIFMTFVLFTGTLAVFAHELDWMVTPPMRVAPQPQPYASWGEIAEAAQAFAPEGRLQTIYAPIDPWFASEVWLDTGDRFVKRVYVNPYTAEVTGTAGWANIHRFLRNTHRHLMLPIPWGVPIVSSLSFILLASLVTGLVTYKKFWRGFFRMPRFGRDARTVTGDIHRLVALWSLWFVAIMIVTGIFYLAEESFGAQAPPHPQPTQKLAAPSVLTGARLDRLIQIGQGAYPSLDIKEIRFPAEEGGRGLALVGQADALLVRDRSNAVWINPDTAEVLLRARGEDLSLHQRISEAADPLHFGTWGGLATKVVWFLFGAMLTALSVTGVMIYSLRLKSAENPAPRGALAKAWGGMGAWAYPAVGLILMSLALTPGAILG